MTIGIIIAAAAVFAIHIDKNHEIKMNPNISRLGDEPIVLRVPSAILLKIIFRAKNGLKNGRFKKDGQMKTCPKSNEIKF